MPTIAFITLGCKLNFAETSTYRRGFIEAGFDVVAPTKQADVYLVNTCSVTQHSDNKCRNLIRKCHKTAPLAAIVVTGCYAQLRRDEVAALEGVKLVFGAGSKTRVVADTLSYLRDGKVPDAAPAKDFAMGYKEVSADMLPAWSAGDRTRSFLKVQDGCNNFCAYCTVPYARGESRNQPISEIICQAEKIASEGVREIVLTGVNTGDFGRSTGESFLDLLKALEKVEGIDRYRISSIEPNLLTDEIIDWTAASGKFVPHFHVPLQTGSDYLLKRVGRRYDTALFLSRIERVRKAFAEAGRLPVFFGIDVIVGLPGETDELFEQTRSFLAETVRPAYIHIFPYSPRPGTRAAKMDGHVTERIKTERVAVLEELCSRLNEEFTDSCRGMSAGVLWEAAVKDGMMAGYTENYIRVEAPYDASKTGTIEEITI